MSRLIRETEKNKQDRLCKRRNLHYALHRHVAIRHITTTCQKESSGSSNRSTHPNPIHPVQQQVCGIVNAARNNDEIEQEIGPSPHHMLFMKKKPASPVHVLLGPPEIIDRNDHPGSQCLKLPSSYVVPQLPDSPQQQRRHGHMKKAEQANG